MTGFEPACLATRVFETPERPDCSTSAYTTARYLSFKCFVRQHGREKIQAPQKKKPFFIC